MRIGLKQKLAMAFFLVISLPMVILGLISYEMSSKALQGSVQQQLRETTDETASSINKTIETLKTTLGVCVNEDSLITVVQKNDSKSNLSAYEYVTKIQRENSDIIESLMVVDNKYNVLVSNDPSSVNMSLSSDDYVKDAMKGSITESGVISSTITGNPIVSVAYPIKSDDKTVGVLVGVIKFENISKYAAKVKVGNNGYAYMIDKSGLIIYHPQNEKILKENLSKASDKNLKSFVVQMKAGKSSEGFYTYEGRYKYVRFQPTNDWVIAVTADYNEYMAPARKILLYTGFIVILSILVALSAGYIYTTRRIINPIKLLEKLMGKAGEGDLTVISNVKTKDEIEALSESFNRMIEGQARIVEKVTVASNQLYSASNEMSVSTEQMAASIEEISASAEQVARDASSQHDSIEVASQVLEQLSNLVEMAEEKALSSNKNSEFTREAAEKGRLKVKETVKAMDVINKSTDDTAKVLRSLNELSINIGQITGTINDIAEQTNLLALNAAIEAARAGEHGKGFSVVAEEVRKLSEQSNDGALKISNLVGEMIKQTEEAVKSMNSGKEAVEKGVNVVRETDEAFVGIINAIEEIVNHIAEIVSVTREEVDTSNQVVKLINDIEEITETNTANSQMVSSASEEQNSSIETLSATAEETTAMATELQELVSKFKYKALEK